MPTTFTIKLTSMPPKLVSHKNRYYTLAQLKSMELGLTVQIVSVRFTCLLSFYFVCSTMPVSMKSNTPRNS